MFWNIPNSLTLVRIILIPVLVGLFLLPFVWAREASAIVFLVAAVTDWFDGYLARRLGQTSKFGAFLDPVADKLMVATALVLLVFADPRIWIAIAAVIASAQASAFWGNGWNNDYNNGYGYGNGYTNGVFDGYGDAAAAGDFSMNFSGRGHTNMRGYGNGYGYGDGWGRGYNYSAPYWAAPYGAAPYGAPMAPTAPEAPVAE